jgi:D-tyrosyl-tRNA(Tyr) deacylase
MKIVLQRVSASVTIENKIVADIQKRPIDFNRKMQIQRKILIGWFTKIRIFEDENQVMNLSVKDIDGEIITVSQPTPMLSLKGNRPSYIKAKPDVAIPLYENLCSSWKELGKKIKQGVLGRHESEPYK